VIHDCDTRTVLGEVSMHGASHLSMRDGVYYYVRRVPKKILDALRRLSLSERQALDTSLRDYFSKSEFVRMSLRTRIKAVASSLAVAKAVEFERNLRELEHWFAAKRAPDAKPLTYLGDALGLGQAYVFRAAVDSQSFDGFHEPHRDQASHSTVHPNAPDLSILLTNIEQRLSSMQQQLESACGVSLDEVEQSRTQTEGRQFPGARKNDPSTTTLGEVIDAYLTQQPQNEFLRKITRALNLFGQYVGREVSVDEVRQVDVTYFLRDVCKLPRDWFRKHKPDTPLRELIRSDREVEGISEPTWTDNYKAPLGSFLRAARRDYGDHGFKTLSIEGIKYVGKRFGNEEQQRGLSVAEVQSLVHSQTFRAISRADRGDTLYWFTLIMLYTGARPREVCQINPQVDFGELEGCWYIDINDKSAAGRGVNKTVKTGESRRLPLHLALVDLGLPDYLKKLRESGSDRLFPGARVKRGNPYVVIGAEFSQLLRDVGLYDDKAPPGRKVLGAYALRKTFITQSRDQGVISKEITGHSDDQTTAIQRKHYITEPEPLIRKAHELSKYKLPLVVPRRT